MQRHQQLNQDAPPNNGGREAMKTVDVLADSFMTVNSGSMPKSGTDRNNKSSSNDEDCSGLLIVDRQVSKHNQHFQQYSSINSVNESNTATTTTNTDLFNNYANETGDTEFNVFHQRKSLMSGGPTLRRTQLLHTPPLTPSSLEDVLPDNTPGLDDYSVSIA